MNIDGVARFAFLGKHSTGLIPAYVLFEARCERFNLSGQVGLLHQYEGAAALDFGNEFVLKQSYGALCEIDDGDLFSTPGAIVQTTDANYLVANAAGWRDLAYYDLKTGDHSGRPGGARVAFASWALFTAEDEKTPLIQFSAQKSA